MAKGLRASVNKRNKSKLRSRVFGPVETARTERLSAKLLELAQQPKPTRSEMEVDTQADKEQQTASTTTVQDKATAEVMEVDGAETTTTAKASNSSSSKKSKDSKGRVQKRGKNTKERNRITFKSYKVPQRRTRDKIGRA